MPITVINEEVRTALGKDLDTISAKLPEGKDFVLVSKEDHIPKSRFDEVNNSSKEYKAKYEDINKQFEALKPLAAGNEELTKKIKELQELNQNTVKDYEGKILARDRDYALNDVVKSYRPRDEKAETSIKKALLDQTKIAFKDGVLSGAKEQLDELKKTSPYLFAEEENKPSLPWMAGTKPGETSSFAKDDKMAGYFGLKQPPKK